MFWNKFVNGNSWYYMLYYKYQGHYDRQVKSLISRKGPSIVSDWKRVNLLLVEDHHSRGPDRVGDCFLLAVSHLCVSDTVEDNDTNYLFPVMEIWKFKILKKLRENMENEDLSYLVQWAHWLLSKHFSVF